MENVQDFIELMQKIEDELRLILKVKYEERLNLGDLLNKANSGLKVKQSIISELDIMREVRNLLSHRHKGKQVIAIPSSTIEKLKSILQDLVHGYMPNDKVVDWIHLALIDKSTSANNWVLSDDLL